MSASAPVSYKLVTRFSFPNNERSNPADVMALMPIVEMCEPVVLRNKIGEQLTMSADIVHFMDPARLPAGETNGEVAVLTITRVRAPKRDQNGGN